MTPHTTITIRTHPTTCSDTCAVYCRLLQPIRAWPHALQVVGLLLGAPLSSLVTVYEAVQQLEKQHEQDCIHQAELEEACRRLLMLPRTLVSYLLLKPAELTVLEQWCMDLLRNDTALVLMDDHPWPRIRDAVVSYVHSHRNTVPS